MKHTIRLENRTIEIKRCGKAPDFYTVSYYGILCGFMYSRTYKGFSRALESIIW